MPWPILACNSTYISTVLALTLSNFLRMKKAPKQIDLRHQYTVGDVANDPEAPSTNAAEPEPLQTFYCKRSVHPTG
eukprot:1027218-Amphidinium_carterae.1